MIRQTFEFTDFDDHKRTAVMYFHLSDIEVVDFSGRNASGIQEEMQDLVATENLTAILKFIRELVAAAYGIKHDDGITFEKSPEITKKFEQSVYYSDWLFSLFENDAEKGLAFIEGVLPAALIQKAQDKIDFEKAAEEKTKANSEYVAGAREQFAQAVPEPALRRERQA